MPKKLLLVDESITIQKVVELVLSEEDFEIITAENGDDALAKLEETPPDIILADVSTPGIDGYELCKKIKEGETKNIPVILLSGAFERIDEEKANKSGASSYIIKPFESQELLNKISDALSASASDDKDADSGSANNDEESGSESIPLETSEILVDEDAEELSSDDETLLEWESAMSEEDGGDTGAESADEEFAELESTEMPSEEEAPLSDDETMLEWEAAFAEQSDSSESTPNDETEINSDFDATAEIMQESQEAATDLDISEETTAGDDDGLLNQSELDQLMDSIKDDQTMIDAVEEQGEDDEEQPLELDADTIIKSMEETDEEEALLKELEKSAQESIEPPQEEVVEPPEEEEGFQEGDLTQTQQQEPVYERPVYKPPPAFEVPHSGEPFLTKGELLSILNESINQRISELLSVINDDKITELLKDAIHDLTETTFLEIKDDFKKIVNEAIDRKINETINSINLEEILKQVISSTIRGIYDNLAKESFSITQETIDRTLKSILEDKISSVNSDTEKAIWETVPDIAERLIKEEIEQIKSEYM